MFNGVFSVLFWSSRIVMAMKLYKTDLSPAARAAMMGCEIFGAPVEMVDVDLIKGEQMSPEFLKKNPLHTVPVLEDGDLIIHDSHAILMYLADAYGKDDSMYPKDLKQRARVNQMICFDGCTLYNKLLNCMLPVWLEGSRTISEKNLNSISESYKLLEEFLSRNKYLAGDQMTIADVSAFVTTTSTCLLVPLDSKIYPKTHAWMKTIEDQPFSQKYNSPGLAGYAAAIKAMIDF